MISHLKLQTKLRGLVNGLRPDIRKRCWLLMLQAFIDDSGSEPAGHSFVLGGLISTVDKWADFVPEWDTCLKQDQPLAYFKATEAHNRAGEFKSGWSRPLVEQRMTELADIAEQYAEYRIHCVMHWSDFDAYLKDIGQSLKPPYDLGFKNPYMVLFFSTVFAVNSFRKAKGIDCECEFIFDEQGKVGEFAADVYQVLKESPALRSQLSALPKFEDDKRVIPLQAADLYAWNVHDACLTEEGQDKYFHIKKGFASLPLIEILIDEKYLVAMRETLLQSAREAPQYLKKPIGS